MKKIFGSLSMVFLVSAFSLNAQNIQPPTGLQVFFKPVDANGNALHIRGHSKINLDTVLQQVTYAISLESVGGISNIHVKLGTTIGGNEKAEFVIPFDAPNNLPAGVSYNRKGNVVYIGVGNYSGMDKYYAEVRLEDSAGYITPAAESSN